jgi:hypothetical protein
MSTSLIEIATELAAEYPIASPQQIADIIVDSIESGSVISQAISYVIIPTPLEMKHAELLSKRLPSKRVPKDKARKRATLLEHIENAPLFKQLKSFYELPLEDTGLGPIIGLDGARVALLPSVQRPDTTYYQLPRQGRPNVDGTQANIPPAPYGSTVASPDNTISESSVRNTREITFASLDFLADVGTESDHFLSFHDIYRIIALICLYPDDEQIIFKVDELVRNDIKLRNRDSKSDCLDELYRGDERLPEELRVQRPKFSDIRGMTLQRIRAIILNQYQRLQSEAGQKFIKDEITYDAYVQAENKYAMYANELAAAMQ